MRRRDFLAMAGAGAVGWTFRGRVAAGAEPAAGVIRWQQAGQAGLFEQVFCEGRPLAAADPFGLLDGRCTRVTAGESSPPVAVTSREPVGRCGTVRVALTHQLHDTASSHSQDLLEAVLTLTNDGDRPQTVDLGFVTSAQPTDRLADQHVYIPISAAALSRDGRMAALGSREFLQEDHQRVGQGDFECHYLEPGASYPTQRTTKALLLAPVVDIYHPNHAWRVAIFTPSDQAVRFTTAGETNRKRGWWAGRCVTVPPRGSIQQRGFLYIHTGDADVAWQAFLRFAHHEDFAPVEWVNRFKVHYYDFLSSANGKDGRRGDGYEADLPHFRTFRVGLATQHGYYPTLGDYVHPDRKTWQAMRGDKQGPVEMSLEKMRARIQATRDAGARAAVYIHPVLFDDATPFFKEFSDCVLVDEAGKMVPFGWKGPDTVGKNWRASIASPQWRRHLIQQTQWIMELLQPDAIVVDETFAGIGYDYHPDHPGPMAGHSIDLYRQMRAIVKSFGKDRALMTSDCSMTGFVMWADGESGDHAYASLLGHALYREAPVRYLAALGGKPWRPCSWHFQRMWSDQMALARQVGAGVGVSNGWLEFTGLAHLPEPARQKILADIHSLK